MDGIPSPRRPHAQGFAHRSPYFYVWDEDAREAESWAAELARASRGLARPEPGAAAAGRTATRRAAKPT